MPHKLEKKHTVAVTGTVFPHKDCGEVCQPSAALNMDQVESSSLVQWQTKALMHMLCLLRPLPYKQAARIM